jgi:hypothetical protein
MAEHDRLAVNRNFRQIVEPGKFFFQLARLFVLICGHGEDLFAMNSSAISKDPLLGSHIKITQEIKNIIAFHGRIQPFDNCLIHLFDGRERAIASLREPRIWHCLRRKVEMLTPATNNCSLGERTLRWPGKARQRIQCVGVLPDPLDDFLNVISGFFREIRTHSFFLDGPLSDPCRDGVTARGLRGLPKMDSRGRRNLYQSGMTRARSLDSATFLTPLVSRHTRPGLNAMIRQ